MSDTFPPKTLDTYPSECTTCRGPVEEDSITLVLPPRDAEARIVHHVPAAVCRVCGEEFLHARTLRAVEKLLREPPARRENVPVWDFAAAG